jgi:hypothetical protein
MLGMCRCTPAFVTSAIVTERASYAATTCIEHCNITHLAALSERSSSLWCDYGHDRSVRRKHEFTAGGVVGSQAGCTTRGLPAPADVFGRGGEGLVVLSERAGDNRAILIIRL